MRCNRSVVSVVLAVAIATAIGCQKTQGGDSAAGLPAVLTPPHSEVDIDQLVAPSLLAYVPADTPYVGAVFEPASTAYIQKLAKMYGPALDKIGAMVPPGDSATDRLFKAVVEELAGKWNEQGLASIGVDIRARSVIYGLGVAPVVVRIDLLDGTRLVSTIEGIAKRAGSTLPARETLHGYELWRIAVSSETEAIIAIERKQLVFALGPRERIAATLPLILGAERPSASMANGKQLKQLITKHRLGANLVGFIDVKRLVPGVLELSGVTLSAACKAESERLTALAPSVVFGAEINEKVMSTMMLLELAPPLIDKLKRLKFAVPGFAEAFDSHPLLAVGSGAHVGMGYATVWMSLVAVRELAKACGREDIAETITEAQDAMPRVPTSEVSAILGGFAVVDSFELSPPEVMQLDGYAMVVKRDPKPLFEQLLIRMPELRTLEIVADGKLHPLKLPRRRPFEVFGGVGSAGIVVAAGRGKEPAERAVSATGGNRAPLFALVIDYGRLFELIGQLSRDASDPNMQVVTGMMKLLGPLAMAIDVTDHGLAWWYRFELK